MAENMNLLGNSTQRNFENFEAVLGILYANTVHVTLTRHSCMRVFQIGSSLSSKMITDFEWRNFVENWNRIMAVDELPILVMRGFHLDLSGGKQEK